MHGPTRSAVAWPSCGADGRRVDAAVAARLRDEPVLGWAPPCCGTATGQGVRAGPALIIGDQSGIALIGQGPPSPLDHRMALLAEPGDIVATRTAAPDFTDYARRWLGLGGVDVLTLGEGAAGPVAQRCRTHPVLFERLRAAASDHGGLTILPYLTTGHEWRLAAALAETAGRPVAVAGPTPRLSRRCNDKLWFGALARDVVGRQAVPPTCAAYGPAAAAGLVARLSRQAPHVVVKVPDSAGSTGNIRLNRADLAGLTTRGIRALLLARLAAIGWTGPYPLLVGVWEENVVASPSVQLWLPRTEQGPPLVEGLTEQTLIGADTAFAGGSWSRQSGALHDRLGREATLIASALQRLGYFGQCSLDAVLQDAGGGALRIHWIECNGRWGGMSIPLAVASRLCGGRAPYGLVVLQEVREGAVAPSMAEMTERLDDLLWMAWRSRRGVVVLSPPTARTGFMANLLALAPERAKADELMRQARVRLGLARG